MNVIVWSAVILTVLGGCSAEYSPSLPSLKPKTPFVKSSDDNSTVCCSIVNAAESDENESEPKVNDLERLPQNIVPYVEKNGMDKDELYETQNNFEKYYFLPWSYLVPPIKVEEASWPVRAFKGGYGSNLRPVLPEWIQEMGNQSNFGAFGTLNQKAITLKWMNIRAFPTDKPLYKKPSLPGEGYPFDLLQNSSVNYNEPIFISHMSKDGAWSYIFTNNASGWVKSEDISMVNEEMVYAYQKRGKVFIVQDNIPLYDMQGKFRVYSRIGMAFPLEKAEEEFFIVNGVDRNGLPLLLRIPKQSAHIGIQKINKSDLIALGNEMLRNTYGWGGMLGERDCSSMIRDMYTPFGIWLPRNSASQARRGEVIVFNGLSDSEKIAMIKEKGVPFETILYLKGHVVLYLGIYDENLVVMHNIWGIRTIDPTGQRGRYIIGKAVISTLAFGAEIENYDTANKLLTRVLSMNIFTRPPSICMTRKNNPVNP